MYRQNIFWINKIQKSFLKNTSFFIPPRGAKGLPEHQGACLDLNLGTEKKSLAKEWVPFYVSPLWNLVLSMDQSQLPQRRFCGHWRVRCPDKGWDKIPSPSLERVSPSPSCHAHPRRLPVPNNPSCLVSEKDVCNVRQESRELWGWTIMCLHYLAKGWPESVPLHLAD